MRKQLVYIVSLLTVSVATQSVAATLNFNALVPDTCTLTLGTPGSLALDSEGSTLSSEEAGGAPAEALLLTSSANYHLEVDPVSSFALAPAGGQPDTMTASLSASGVTVAAGVAAGTPLNIGVGLTNVEVDLTAEKGSGVFPAGTYRLDLVMRCAPR